MCTIKKNASIKEHRFRADLVHASQSLDVVRGVCHNFSFPRHTHEEYTIGMVHSGQEVIRCRGVSNHAGVGSVYFYHPDEAHDGAAIDKGGWTFTSIYISPQVFIENAGGNLKKPDLPSFSQSVFNNKRMSLQFLELTRILQSSPCQMERHSCVLAFLKIVLKKNSTNPANGDAKKFASEKIGLIKDFIQENFRDAISLKDISEIASIHPGYLIDVFQKSEGITPHAYLVAQRVNASRKALLDGVSPANAAIDCGFFDQSHMNRHFRRTFGLSPAKFRQTHHQLSGRH